MVSAAKTLVLLLGTRTPRVPFDFWQAQPFAGLLKLGLLGILFYFSPGHQLKKQSGTDLPAVPGFA